MGKIVVKVIVLLGFNKHRSEGVVLITCILIKQYSLINCIHDYTVYIYIYMCLFNVFCFAMERLKNLLCSIV